VHTLSVERIESDEALAAPFRPVDLGDRIAPAGGSMANVTYEKEITALLLIDPYNDFISEGGKVWDRLKGVAEANQCILQIGHIERFNPAFTTGRALLPLARTIRSVRTTRHPPRPSALDVVIDLMIHDLDLILHSLGSSVMERRAAGRSRGLTAIDEAEVELTFSNGCRAYLGAHWGRGMKQEERRMVAELENDETWVIDFRQRITYRKALNSSLDTSPANSRTLPFPAQRIREDTLSLQLAAFLDACRNRSLPQVTPAEGNAALELAHHIRQQILRSCP